VARDVILKWNGAAPPNDAILSAIKTFFGGAYGTRGQNGNSPEWDRDRWFVTLPGTNPAAPEGCRWIEIWPSPDGACLYVMTRQQDDFTNALADGLARSLRRQFGGKLET
jgi:hypothetical protein